MSLAAARRPTPAAAPVLGAAILLVATLLTVPLPAAAQDEPPTAAPAILQPWQVPLPLPDPDPWWDSGHLHRWDGEPGWVAGASVYDDGEFIHTDFVYDDTGAGTRAAYPHDFDTYRDNAADIAEVRVARAAQATVLRVTLTSLATADSTVLGIGLGTGAGSAADGTAWPLGAGVAVPPGIDTALTVVADRLLLHDLQAGETTDRPDGAQVVTDTELNTVEVLLPDALVDLRGGFDLTVMAGLWDAAADAWMPITALQASPEAASGGNPGDPAVFNVAFRVGEDPYARSNSQDRANDAVQGEALAAGDISAFVATVDTGLLEQRATVGVDLAERSGTYIRTYRSRLDLGEGVYDRSGGPCEDECTAEWLSRFVPYLVDVPEAYDGTPVGIVFAGHGAGDNHTQNETNVDRTQAYRDELGTIVVGDSGRGNGSLYQQHGELDQLEVLADVARHYAIDADHVIKMGESMGGIGTYIFGMRTPHLARSIVPLDGVAMWHPGDTTEDAIAGEYTGETHVFSDLVVNLTNTPVHAEAAFGDPLVRWDLAYNEHVLPLEALGGRVDHYVCQGTHITQWALSERWVNFIEAELRGPAPPLPSRIRYATDAVQQELSTPYGLAARDAWWVQDLEPVDGGAAAIDVRTHTLPNTEPAELVDGDAVLPPTPEEDGGLGPCQRTAQAWEGTQPTTPANRVEATLSGIATLTLDAEMLQVQRSTPLVLALDSDTDASVRLVGYGAGRVSVDDGTAAALPPHPAGGVALPVRQGAHTYTVEPVAAQRLAGPDRIDTAVAVSRELLADAQAGAVVLARADGFADALAGVPLAAQVDGPLLLTGSDGLEERTAAEIARVLRPGGRVHVLGGEAALSAAVEDDVRALGYRSSRHGGPTRFDTAASIAAELVDVLPEPLGTVAIADGGDFRPAMVAGPAVAGSGVILLSDGDHAVAATEAFLAQHPTADVVAIGAAAARAHPDATAVAGSGAHETAVAVAEAFFDAPTSVGLATSEAFADGLAGGVLMAHLGGPMVLTPQAELDVAVDSYLAGLTAVQLRLFGGPAALSTGVEELVLSGS